MTSSHDLMSSYRECSRIVRTAGGDVLPIEGVGDILLRFPSDSGAFDIQLLNVAFVPQLSHNLLSLEQFTAAHHTCFGTKNGVELKFKSGRTLQARTFNAVYFMRSKDEVSRYFRQYLADYRFTGVPCPVGTVRTDDAAEFKGGAFADLCRERGIMQEFTTADRPQFNGVAERGIAMIESAGKAAIIQAGLNFRGMGIPSGNSLWAAQAYWACRALNSTATTSNPRCMTPYEMWYGKVPPSPFPFLKPGFVKRKRGNKLEPKAVPCFYIGPSPNRPRDSMRVMLRSGAMVDSRHVTWACIPFLTPAPDYRVSSMIGRGRGGSKTAEFRSEEVEPAGVESDASGKDQVDVWSEGSDSKPVTVEVGCGESEDEDEELYIFPQCAPAPAPAHAPKGRAAQLPS